MAGAWSAGAFAPDADVLAARFWGTLFMRRSLIRSLPAIGLLVSVHTAAFAQDAPLVQKAPPPPQPTSSDPGFIEKLVKAYVVEFDPPAPVPATQTAAAPSGRLPAAISASAAERAALALDRLAV